MTDQTDQKNPIVLLTKYGRLKKIFIEGIKKISHKLMKLKQLLPFIDQKI